MVRKEELGRKWVPLVELHVAVGVTIHQWRETKRKGEESTQYSVSGKTCLLALSLPLLVCI
jgi:hypothetical protein